MPTLASLLLELIWNFIAGNHIGKKLSSTFDYPLLKFDGTL